MDSSDPSRALSIETLIVGVHDIPFQNNTTVIDHFSFTHNFVISNIMLGNEYEILEQSFPKE